jgi:hypothetical protein
MSLAGALLLPAVATAQARVFIAPSASAGYVFDDNLFSTPDEQALGDQILRVTPGLSASRETQHTYWFGGYSFDAERYQDHSILTTPVARQTAGALTRIATSPRTAWTISGGYDSTVNPSELNVTTGIFAGRLRGWRWRAAPEVRHALTPVSSLTARYDVTGDYLLNDRVLTHAASLIYAYSISPRNELRVEPFIRQFVFNRAPALAADGESSTLAAAGGTLGWIYRLTPFTSLNLHGGPRFVQRSKIVRPELDMMLERRTEYSEFSVSYVRSMTTAVGVDRVIDSQRMLARAGYHHPAVLDVTLQGGVYINDFSSTSRVYQISTDITRAFAPALAVSFGYSLNLQRGLFNPLSVLSDPTQDLTLGPDAPTAFSGPINVPLRRNVLYVRLVVAPTIKPTREPPARKPAPGTTTSSEGNR